MYAPPDVMVPYVALPPATPFTDQVYGPGPPLTTEKACVPPGNFSTLAGLITSDASGTVIWNVFVSVDGA